MNNNSYFSKLNHTIVDSGIWASLKPGAKAIYIVLLRYASFETGICRPTNETIGKQAGIHKKNVPKFTQELQNKGLIKKWRKGFRTYYKVIRDMIPQIMETYPKPETKPTRPRDKKGKFKTCSIEDGLSHHTRYDSIKGNLPESINYGLAESINYGFKQSIDYGNEIEIRKRDIERDNNKDMKPNLVDDLYYLFKQDITKENITKTLLANWGEDPGFALERAGMSVKRANNPPGLWITLMRDRASISLKEPENEEPNVDDVAPDELLKVAKMRYPFNVEGALKSILPRNWKERKKDNYTQQEINKLVKEMKSDGYNYLPDGTPAQDTDPEYYKSSK